VYKDLNTAARKMTEPPSRKFVPNKKASGVYEQLYAEYVRLHDQLGRDPNSVLKRLKAIRAAAET
jgi:L-ribulokinase